MIIEALRSNVVELVQDLNGNHVVQKCLNRLTGADAQVGSAVFRGSVQALTVGLVYL